MGRLGTSSQGEDQKGSVLCPSDHQLMFLGQSQLWTGMWPAWVQGTPHQLDKSPGCTFPFPQVLWTPRV